MVILISFLSFVGPEIASSTQDRRPHAIALSGAYWGAHDPSIIFSGGTWYVFATGKAPNGGELPIRCSNDLSSWKFCGQVFSEIPHWIQVASPGTRDLWAPDISFENGEFRLYYAYSLFGKNTSGIALATNKTLDPHSPAYKWVDRGLVLRSTASENFNAIDPNFALDTAGHAWLAFGSFWSGIKMRRLNARTGLLSTRDTRLYSLATRKKPSAAPPAKPGLPPDWQAVEAPFIVHHGHFYYLVVSWDLCCRGTKSTYRTMVGRAKSITGPYLDKSGVPLMDGGGTELLTGNRRWLGPGGASIWMAHSGRMHSSSTSQPSDGTQQPRGDIIAFHAYDARTGKPALQISTLTWKHGWPDAALGH